MPKVRASVRIKGSANEVYREVLAAGKALGEIKKKSKEDRVIVIRRGLKIFPLRNASSVRVALTEVSSTRTEVTFTSLGDLWGWKYYACRDLVFDILKKLDFQGTCDFEGAQTQVGRRSFATIIFSLVGAAIGFFLSRYFLTDWINRTFRR